MKKVLITGAGSYIGTSVKNWLDQYPEQYQVDEIDMKDNEWREQDFSPYDVVFHVAGLAHADIGKVTEEEKAMYYNINRDLTVETARKAKAEGVRQFIFMSSIIVYGSSGKIGSRKVITKDTQPIPDNFYGDSKLQAENGIRPLTDERFTVTILRPPMIYGKGSRGNYPMLSKMAQILPAFPNIENERSILYIGNLCEFVRLIIDIEKGGILFPQNEAYAQTSDMVKIIAQVHRKNLRLTGMFNWLVVLLGKMVGKIGNLANKAFGNLIYDKNMSSYMELGKNYQIFSLQESINLTESAKQ